MLGIVLILLVLISFQLLSNAFTILALAGIITITAYRFPNMYKRAWILYTVAFLITIVGIVFYEDYYYQILQGGLLGYSFIFVVMFVGVLPNKLTITRHIKKNRGVFSILGFIFISSHAILHLFTFGIVNIYGLIAYGLMVPLTIISFRVIRKEIPPKDWFTIQKAAYLIYIVLFVHLYVVSAVENKVVYAILATLYINNKLLKEYKKWVS